MSIFRRKHKLKKEYDKELFYLMHRQKQLWEDAKVMEEIIIDENPELISQRKMAKARYFYLFKEAKVRNLHGDI